MERRSARGRQEVATPIMTAGRRGAASKTQSEPRPSAITTPQTNLLSAVVPASEVPAVGAEEVVLNRRGMPARQRKRNRLYFDDDMVTPENWGAAIARNAKKVKAEPVDDSEDDTGEEILGDIPGVTSSPASYRQNARARSSPSPVKSPTRQPTPKKVVEIPLEKGPKKTPTRPTVNEKTSPQRGRSMPTLQLISTSPERSPRAPKAVSGKSPVPPPPKSTTKSATPKIKSDPDGPAESVPSRKNNVDKWGKLVQRADSIKKNRDDREVDRRVTDKKSGSKVTSDHEKDNHDVFEKRSPSKKELQRQQQERERERLLKEKEKKEKEALLKEKEQERLAKEKEKERQQLEKEKKSLQKEKKRDHREPITVLPPVVKIASRATYLTTEELNHQPQPIQQQQLMAVIKIDDTTTQVIDKRVAHDISIRLRNLLKLPKAHKWVCYEWFYSNIDK